MSKFSKFGKKAIIPALVATLMASVLTACAPAATGESASTPAKTVRVGYFANLTHAPALIARQQKLFEKYLGDTKVEYTYFTAGPAAIEALKGGALDVAYIGPNPSVSGYLSTNGSLLNIVSGATSAGAKFIVKPDLIATEGAPTDAEIAALAGHNFASPQLGGTQDVALRNYLADHALTFSGSKPDVTITPLANADTLAQFKLGNIDGAWVPEPWATRLVLEGSGKVFVDEATLWQDGQFVTTNIVASQKFLKQHAVTVKAILQANIDAIDFLNKPENESSAKEQVQAELLAGSGKSLAADVIDAAWKNLKFTNDPLASTLLTSFDAAVKVEQLKGKTQDDLKGIYNLDLLNSLLSEKGATAISVPAELVK